MYITLLCLPESAPVQFNRMLHRTGRTQRPVLFYSPAFFAAMTAVTLPAPIMIVIMVNPASKVFGDTDGTMITGVSGGVGGVGGSGVGLFAARAVIGIARTIIMTATIASLFRCFIPESLQYHN